MVWRILKASERKQWWEEIFREDPRRAPGTGSSAAALSDSEDASELSDKDSRVASEGAGSSTEAGGPASIDEDDLSDHAPWEAWEDFVSELEAPLPPAVASEGAGWGRTVVASEGAGQGRVAPGVASEGRAWSQFLPCRCMRIRIHASPIALRTGFAHSPSMQLLLGRSGRPRLREPRKLRLQ